MSCLRLFALAIREEALEKDVGAEHGSVSSDVREAGELAGLNCRAGSVGVFLQPATQPLGKHCD